jgi:hypothetical protein
MGDDKCIDRGKDHDERTFRHPFFDLHVRGIRHPTPERAARESAIFRPLGLNDQA